MTFHIPSSLAASCAKSYERTEWLAELPQVIADVVKRWSLRIGTPFDSDEVSCSWVASVQRANGSPAVLKIGMPHMESEDEIAGLRLLDGDPAVRLLDADVSLNAMLLERCVPGIPLRTLFQPDQDIVIANLLKRYWRVLPENHDFRPLAMMIRHWIAETREDEHLWYDAPLVAEGIAVLEELASTSFSRTLLATDLHAGNVLSAQREPWLVIDPKPFAGDPAYDATQHLLNSRDRLRTDAQDTIRRIADLLELDHHRVRLWTFGRLAAEPRDDWDDESTALARVIAP